MTGVNVYIRVVILGVMLALVISCSEAHFVAPPPKPLPTYNSSSTPLMPTTVNVNHYKQKFVRGQISGEISFALVFHVENHSESILETVRTLTNTIAFANGRTLGVVFPNLTRIRVRLLLEKDSQVNVGRWIIWEPAKESSRNFRDEITNSIAVMRRAVTETASEEYPSDPFSFLEKVVRSNKEATEADGPSFFNLIYVRDIALIHRVPKFNHSRDQLVGALSSPPYGQRFFTFSTFSFISGRCTNNRSDLGLRLNDYRAGLPGISGELCEAPSDVDKRNIFQSWLANTGKVILNRHARPDSIQVTVDNRPTTQFTYNAGTNEISLNANDGSVVEVIYEQN